MFTKEPDLTAAFTAYGPRESDNGDSAEYTKRVPMSNGGELLVDGEKEIEGKHMADQKNKQHEINATRDDSGDDYAALREPEDRNKTEQVGDDLSGGPGLGGIIGVGIGLFIGAMIGLMLPMLGIIEFRPLFAGAVGAFVGGLTGWMVGSLFGVAAPEEGK